MKMKKLLYIICLKLLYHYFSLKIWWIDYRVPEDPIWGKASTGTRELQANILFHLMVIKNS
jgi:hypothetical protein